MGVARVGGISTWISRLGVISTVLFFRIRAKKSAAEEGQRSGVSETNTVEKSAVAYGNIDHKQPEVMVQNNDGKYEELRLREIQAPSAYDTILS